MLVIEKDKWCKFMFVQQGPGNMKDSDVMEIISVLKILFNIVELD